MIDVSLVYDPVSSENRFITVNGRRLDEQSPLAAESRKMLQSWIGTLPDQLERAFQGETSVNLTFTGTQSDLEDVEAMVKIANRRGFKVELVRHNLLKSPAEQFSEFVRWLDEQKQKRFFADLLKNNPEKLKELGNALGDRFDVYVIATMSSGKSTLINAFLYRELMPSANEATTAVITEIKNAHSNIYSGAAYQGNKKIDSSSDVSLNIMQEWNRNENVETISIDGPLPFVRDEADLNVVLTDTPGPNNSRDERHGVVTMGKIADNTKKPLILYVLNAEQLGINDDKNLLMEIGKVIRDDPQARDRFLFILNKADAFDPEKEEIDAVLKRCRAYLGEAGIENPFIYPVSARLALLARKEAGTLNRRDKGDLDKFKVDFLPVREENWPGIDFNAKAPTTFSMPVEEENELVRRSGMGALEAAVRGYARKYNYPFRLHRVAQVALEVLEVGKGEERFKRVIAKNQSDIQQFRNICQTLKDECTKVWESQSSLDELNELKGLPRNFIEGLQEKRAERAKILNEIGAGLTGISLPHEIDQALNGAKEKVELFYNKHIAYLKVLQDESRSDVDKKLKSFYNEKMKNIFSGLDDSGVKHPFLQGLGDFTLNIDLGLSEKEITKTAREVSTSRWWNPLSWGDKEIVYDKKVENVQVLWEARAQKIKKIFDDSTNKAEKMIIDGREAYVNAYVDHVNKLLPEKLDQLSQQISQYEGNAAKSKQTMIEAEERLEEISAVRDGLETILRNFEAEAAA